MKKAVGILVLLLLACFSGGCAVVPALVTTGASFAVPQTASLAITAAGTVHKTALIAADERHVDDMISDKMLTIQAQAVLMAEPGADMEATCLNGDLYVVGEYATPADRESAIDELQQLKGVNVVKGVVKQMPSSLAALVKPAIADSHAETVIETGLIKELHIRSANVDVEVVQGEAVIMGVVANAAEAAEIVRLVHRLRPRAKTPIRVTSLLAVQEDFDAGLPQHNALFTLQTRRQMLAAAKSEQSVPAPSVQTVPREIPPLTRYVEKEQTAWQKARSGMKRRILTLAKGETDPRAKRELITLSSRVLKDRNTSIEDRLVTTMNRTTNLSVKQSIGDILDDIAPRRTKRIHTLAMN